MALNPYQVQFGLSGPIFGPGTTVQLAGIPSGLRDLAPLRSADVAYTMSDGMLPGMDFAGGRLVQFDWECTLASGGVEAALASLAAQHAIVRDPDLTTITAGDYLANAMAGTSKPVSVMQVQLPGRPVPLLLFGRPSRFTVPITNDYQFGRVQPKSEWSVPDGIVYDTQGTLSGSCGLPNPTSGMTFNAAFPLSFGSSSGGSFVLVNAGNSAAPCALKITGPCTSPTITNAATGESIMLNITLASTDVVLIDTHTGTVTYNGANRNNTVLLGTSFFQIQPGTNTISFASRDSVAVAAQLSGSTLSAYSVA